MKCPSANCRRYSWNKNCGWKQQRIPMCLEPSCLFPTAWAGLGAPVGCAGEERTGSFLLSPGYECGCRGGSTALWSGMMGLELCCCVSLVLSLLLNSRSGIGCVSSPRVFGACSDCRGVLLCYCYSLRQGRVLLCRAPVCLSPRCSSPEQFWCLKQQFPSANSSLPFKFCSHLEVPQSWCCQAWSTAQEVLDSLGRELRALCVLHSLALNLQGESLKMLNISKMCPPLSSYVALSPETLPLAAPSRGVWAADSPSSVLGTSVCHCHLLQGNVQQVSAALGKASTSPRSHRYVDVKSCKLLKQEQSFLVFL